MAATLAKLVMVPAAVGVTTMVAVALAALVKLPRLQVTILPKAEHPGLGVAETKVTPGGSVSVRNTLVAADGPLLVTVTV